MLVKQNSDGSYSAQQRSPSGRLMIAEGKTAVEAMRRCMALAYAARDISVVQARWAAANNQPGDTDG